MGRHSAPPTVDRASRRPLYLGVTVAVVVLVFAVVALALALRGDDGNSTTADPAATSPTSTQPPSSAALPSSASLTPSNSASASAAATPSPTPTPSSSPPSSTPATPAEARTTKPRRPPTMRLEWLGTSYVRVQVGGGRTVFEEIEHKGAVHTFDQHSVTALVGDAAQVRAIVNGKPRQPGGSGQVETIVARR